jgi:hypothetical protein
MVTFDCRKAHDKQSNYFSGQEFYTSLIAEKLMINKVTIF